MNASPTRTVPVDVIASSRTWMESDAVGQLRATAGLPGMLRAVGLPDLHPGPGTPVGAVFACAGWVYPHLVGSDIGCGMSLSLTDLKRSEVRLDRWERRLDALKGPWEGDATAWLAAEGIDAPTAHDAALGTIGLGNHFAEVQAVQEVLDEPVAAALGIDRERILLLVHSGSRGLGEAILRAHTDRFAGAGLEDGTPAQAAYLAQHDAATAWARANRALIAQRVSEALGAEARPLIDVAHNVVTPGQVDGRPCWMHRKGATQADQGPVVVAGTRGTLSYVVAPAGDGVANLATLAHGAGRKWKRSEARGRLEGRYRAQDLTRTALGGRVICADKDLLYEEAPQAYKDAERVVADLVEAGVATVVATLRPLLTYKTGARPGRR
jgi:release factor H-coupled RctB family protein